MGYMFTQGATKKDVIKEITAPYTSIGGLRVTTIAQCVRGNILWTVSETTLGDRWICCHLLGAERGFGWGYKSMDESMHPYYYSCPLKYLDMVPKVTNDTWRREIRYRAEKKQADRKVRQVRKEARVTLMEAVGLFTTTT